MSERVWDDFLTEQDKAVFKSAGYGTRGDWGKRPALLIIDVSYGFTGEIDEPILESIKTWPNSCGHFAWRSIPYLQKLLNAARAKTLPIIYTTGHYRNDQWDMGSWAWKNGRTDDWDGHGQNRDGNDIIDELAPQPQDLVIRKLKPSAFSSTPLNSFLTLLGADSIIVTGTSTSGCVRASVIDAFSENYRVTLAEEGCFDRSEASHAINLCDMNAKYANVMPTDEVINYIKTLPEELFNLPSGTPSAF